MMQRMSLTLAVNGKPQEVPTGSLLPELLKTLGLADAQVALEINGELVPKRKWPVRELSAGDRIEVVTLVGGG